MIAPMLDDLVEIAKGIAGAVKRIGPGEDFSFPIADLYENSPEAERKAGLKRANKIREYLVGNILVGGVTVNVVESDNSNDVPRDPYFQGRVFLHVYRHANSAGKALVWGGQHA